MFLPDPECFFKCSLWEYFRVIAAVEYVSKCTFHEYPDVYIKSNNLQKCHAYFSLMLSTLLFFSLPVLHWIINIFGSSYMTQWLVKGQYY